MVAVVAISMALTPLFMLVNEKFIQPRICKSSAPVVEREDDIPDEENQVIIAGFGHFGSTIGPLFKCEQYWNHSVGYR
jgi:hypothetical protein